MKKKITILSRITYILLSVFFTTTIFAILQKNYENWGMLIALIITLSTGIKLARYNKGTWRSIIGWSIIWTLLIGGTTVGIIMATVSYTIDSVL